MDTRRRVWFDHFWTGLVPDEFYVPLFGRALGQDPDVAPGDITVTSVFATRREKALRLLRRDPDHLPRPPAQSRYRLWQTGENIRPPWRDYDLTLSFDLEDYGGRNLYLPLAVLALDWFPERRPGPRSDQRKAGSVLTPQAAAAPRDPVSVERPRFACAFIANPEPRRLYAIEALSRYAPVDVFGPAVGRPVPSKAEIAKDYRFVVCFENDLFPGYVTEKAVEAYATGAVPLWSGDDAAGLFRPEALVNEAEFGSIRAWVDHVADLDRSPHARTAMAGAPLFHRAPDLTAIVDRLRADLG